MQHAQEIELCGEKEFSRCGHAALHKSSQERFPQGRDLGRLLSCPKYTDFRHHAKEMERSNHGISEESTCLHVVLSVQTRHRPEVHFSAAGKTT